MRFSKGRFSNSIIRRREYDNPSVFCCRKSLPLEGKVAQRERSRMRWISKSISSYGSDERIAFVSLNTSSVNFVASFPSRGSRFLEERTYTPPCGSDACASGKQKPSEKEVLPGRFKSVSFRQTGICMIILCGSVSTSVIPTGACIQAVKTLHPRFQKSIYFPNEFPTEFLI